MAQRTEKEETEFKVVPEPTITTLCVKCGGVAANTATNSLCHNCLNSTATTSTASAASSAVAKPLNRVKSYGSISSPRSSQERKLDSNETSRDPSEEEASSPPAKRAVNRCSGCRRKVGLTGFRCRCGELFCAEHRYSDRHECTYDYKSAGRDAIARENPVVKAAKIVKI